jgi:hypothetical protein
VPEEPDVVVFISYRRSDTSADAGRLYDALRRRYGRDSVFMDVDSIRPGEDWVVAVEDAVGRCDALLALIGREWNDVRDENGKRRLEDEFDRVRLEIEAALKNRKAVIPVLFGEAHMPLAAELPESLRPLVRRNATRISHATFENDLRGLLRALKTIARAKARTDSAAAPAIGAALPEAPTEPLVGSPPQPPPPPIIPPPIIPPPQPSPPPAAYYAQPQPPSPQPPPAQPSPGGTTRGGGSRLVLFGAIGFVAVILLGLLAWAVIGAPKPQPTPSPTPGPSAPPTATAAQPTATAAQPTPTQPPVATSTPTEPAPTDVPTAATLDFTLPPAYGEAGLAAGFQPDPFTQDILGGGSVDVSYLGLESCLGFAAAPPDLRVMYTAGSAEVLRFYFIADSDTSLIINDPSGNWFCSDDTFGTLNPGIDYAAPEGGTYDVWVGSISGDFVSGTLFVTELTSNHP